MEFNIADLYESIADVIGERTALVAGERRLTFAELDVRANRMAHFFTAQGVKAGDHVGMHLYNCAEFVETMLGLFKIRAVPININYRYVAHEVKYLAENSDMVALVTQYELQSMALDAIAGVDAVKTVVALGDDSGEPLAEGVIDYEDAMAQGHEGRGFGPRSGDDLYIIYTGGTTGMPKGVMWRQEDVFFAGLQGGAPGDDDIETPEALAERIIDEDYALNMLPAAPFIHGSAQWTCWIGLFTGGTLILQPGKSFDAQRVCELIDEEEATTLTLVGDAMARPVVEELLTGKYDMESVVAVASAGAILTPTVRMQLEELLPDAMILNNFGASETGHQGSAIPGEEFGAEGRPSFYMDESNVVLGEDNTPITPGSGVIGRLARKGRVPLGYYKDPVKTAERFVTIDGDRYVVAGDYATVEEDGRVTVYGRGSVCINTGGEKVYPSEVEETLKQHPDVFDVLVVGIADAKWMQRVAAVIEPRAGATPSLEDLQAHCRTMIAGYKVPRVIRLVDKVERQPSGKPDYKWAFGLMEDA